MRNPIGDSHDPDSVIPPRYCRNLSNLPPIHRSKRPIKESAEAFKTRLGCERAHQQRTEDLGLDQFEKRSSPAVVGWIVPPSVSKRFQDVHEIRAYVIVKGVKTGA